MIEVETQTTEVEIINNVEVISAGQVEVETVDLSDLDITVAKKEYVITGDDIYIPMLYDDAPQWMKDLVQVVVDVSISSGNQSLINNMNAILQDFAVRYVPLNQYTQSIIDLSDEDTRLNGLIETLNSNFNDGLSIANAQIISLQLTKASKDEVVAQVIQTIAAQLADGTSNIGSTIGRIDQAIANETSARALSLQTLTASLEDTNLDVTANAEVIQNALAYVGIDEAGASTGTGLSAYLEDSNGNIGGADSQLANSIRVTAEGVESKFAYNSLLNINGVYKKSGFGLTTNYVSGSGTQIDPYVSEFWIDASRFKFTNSNVTGSVAPFTIDASGANPQIKFNGVVNFSNITNVPQLGSTPQEVVTAINNAQTTTINGPRITTGSITAGQIQAGSVSADRLTSTNGSSTVWAGGGLISANFNGNVVGNIGSPTAGFRLSSNAAGTLGSNDPNIYGAYILGSIIDASSSFITSSYLDSSKTGSAIATKVNPILYGANYSSGFLSTRFTKTSSYAIVSALGRQYIQEDHPSTTYLEYTVNDGATWGVLDSVYNSSSGGKLDTRVTLTGVVISSSVPTTGYMQFRTRYIVNGDTSFTDVTIIATVYNI